MYIVPRLCLVLTILSRLGDDILVAQQTPQHSTSSQNLSLPNNLESLCIAESITPTEHLHRISLAQYSQI